MVAFVHICKVFYEVPKKVKISWESRSGSFLLEKSKVKMGKVKSVQVKLRQVKSGQIKSGKA